MSAQAMPAVPQLASDPKRVMKELKAMQDMELLGKTVWNLWMKGHISPHAPPDVQKMGLVSGWQNYDPDTWDLLVGPPKKGFATTARTGCWLQALQHKHDAWWFFGKEAGLKAVQLFHSKHRQAVELFHSQHSVGACDAGSPNQGPYVTEDAGSLDLSDLAQSSRVVPWKARGAISTTEYGLEHDTNQWGPTEQMFFCGFVQSAGCAKGKVPLCAIAGKLEEQGSWWPAPDTAPAKGPAGEARRVMQVLSTFFSSLQILEGEGINSGPIFQKFIRIPPYDDMCDKQRKDVGEAIVQHGITLLATETGGEVSVASVLRPANGLTKLGIAQEAARDDMVLSMERHDDVNDSTAGSEEQEGLRKQMVYMGSVGQVHSNLREYCKTKELDAVATPRAVPAADNSQQRDRAGSGKEQAGSGKARPAAGKNNSANQKVREKKHWDAKVITAWLFIQTVTSLIVEFVAGHVAVGASILDSMWGVLRQQLHSDVQAPSPNESGYGQGRTPGTGGHQEVRAINWVWGCDINTSTLWGRPVCVVPGTSHMQEVHLAEAAKQTDGADDAALAAQAEKAWRQACGMTDVPKHLATLRVEVGPGEFLAIDESAAHSGEAYPVEKSSGSRTLQGDLLLPRHVRGGHVYSINSLQPLCASSRVKAEATVLLEEWMFDVCQHKSSRGPLTTTLSPSLLSQIGSVGWDEFQTNSTDLFQKLQAAIREAEKAAIRARQEAAIRESAKPTHKKSKKHR